MIELKPVLNKKDLENISLYQKMPYRQFYNDNDEGKIYDVVKSVRKQNSYWPSKIDDKKPETYSNLIINKPKTDAPASTASKLLWIINWVYEDWTKIVKKVWEKKDEAISKVWDALVPDFISTGYQFIKPQLKAVTDYALPTALWVPEELKSNYKWTKALQPLTTTAFEVVSAVSQPLENIGKASYLKVKENYSLPYDIVKWTIDWKWVKQIFKDREERQFYDRLFLWVNWFDDILTISTSNERRKEMINQLSNPADKEKAEKYLEDNKWQIMWTDILYWVWAWIIWWGWIRWAASAIKNKWVRDILNVTANVIDPSLNDLAKVWVVLWALSWIQYATNWSFWIEWETAEEGAFIALWATALKWMWVAIPATYKGVKELLSTDEVKDWMDMFFGRMADLTWARMHFLPPHKGWDIFTKSEQDEIYKAIKDVKLDWNNELLKVLEKHWMVDGNWLFNDKFNRNFPTYNEQLNDLWIWINRADDLIEEINQEQPKALSNSKIKEDDIKYAVNSIPERWIFKAWEKNIQRKLIDTWYTYNKDKWTISNWLNIRTKQLEQRFFQRREIEAVKMFWWNEADIANLEQLRIRWSEENLVKAFNKKAKSLSENALNKYWEYIQLKSRYMQMVNRNTDTLAKLEELWNEKAWIEAAIEVAKRVKNPTEDNFKEIFNLENKLTKLNKEIEKVTAANKLDTKVNIGWIDIVFRTTDELDAYLKWVESKYNSVVEMSDLQASLQKTVLNWLYDSWVISAKQYDALMRNPYYVPAKLTEESKKGDIGEQMYEMRAGLIKWLWEWSDELNFSLDGIDNLINYYRRAYSIMTKNDFLKEFDEIATRWWQDLINLKNKEWFTSVPMFKDWERFDIFLPNFVTKRFEVDDVSQNLFLKTLRKWNQLSKVLITSYEPLFVAKMLLSEHLAALMQSANTWTVSWEFFNFLPKKAATKVWEILKSDIWDRDFYNAMSQYIDATWASYWWMKGTSKDMLNELSSYLYYSKNAYLRWYINTIDWVWKVFSDVEKYSTRWPVFTSALYKNAQDVWMDKAEFRTLVKSFLNKETWLLDDRWLTKALKEKWINANLAAKYSRGIFDYLSAWDDFVFLWRYIAYANLVPVTGKALYNFSVWAIKRLWSLPTKQKNRAIAWITATIWAVQSMAFVNYAYNYWLFKFTNESDEWFEERKRLWELLRTQPDYTKFRPWRAYLWTDWKIHHSNIGILNNTLYDFVYRATYTAMELARWNWMDWDWVLKQADDLTYFTKARWGVLESINLFTPTTLKWALESSFNKSLYHWGQIYTPWLWLNDDKNVWVIANTIWDILSFWYSEWPLWEKVWGFQVNKKMLDNVIKFWDPEKNWFIKTLINNAQSEIINSSVNWITPKETNYIFRLFWSSAKIMDETINWLYNASNDVSSNYKIQQNLVKNTFSETKSKEEAIDAYVKLAKNARASYWKDHKLVKYIEWELLNRIKALEWNWIVKNLNALQANAIWKRMAELSNEWNTSEIKNIEKWMIEAWFTTYKTKQVIIARKLYSAKTEEELKTISVNLLKTFKSDDAKTNDYIRRTILEVRDLLNAK